MEATSSQSECDDKITLIVSRDDILEDRGESGLFGKMDLEKSKSLWVNKMSQTYLK